MKEQNRLLSDYADRLYRAQIFGDAAGTRKRFLTLMECFAQDIRLKEVRDSQERLNTTVQELVANQLQEAFMAGSNLHAQRTQMVTGLETCGFVSAFDFEEWNKNRETKEEGTL